MAWLPSQNEISAVLNLDGPKRYSYLIKHVADEEKIWGLFRDGSWALAADESGTQLVPVWPHFKFAEMCSNGVWDGFAPKEIPLKAWLERWIPGMLKDKRMVAIFPTPNDKGVSVEPKRFEADLQEELANYE